MYFTSTFQCTHQNISHSFIVIIRCGNQCSMPAMLYIVGIVRKIQMDLQANPDCIFNRPILLRSLFTVGLLCKNFDFDSENFGEKKVIG